METTARGLHFQLLCIAAQKRPAGTLPDNDAQWRKWCGIPAETSRISKRRAPLAADLLLGTLADPAALASLQAGDPHLLVQQLWEKFWKPQISLGWHRVDDLLIEERPYLARAKGGWWSPVAEAIGGHRAAAAPAHATAKKPAATKKARSAMATEPATTALHTPSATEDGDSIEHALDIDTPWADVRRVKAAWRATLPRPVQESLWDLGVKALEPGVGSKAARQQLVGLINKYGEPQVSQAIGILLGRATRPADPIAFVVRTLKNQTEGSPNVQRARAQRTSVAL